MNIFEEIGIKSNKLKRLNGQNILNLKNEFSGNI